MNDVYVSGAPRLRASAAPHSPRAVAWCFSAVGRPRAGAASASASANAIGECEGSYCACVANAVNLLRCAAVPVASECARAWPAPEAAAETAAEAEAEAEANAEEAEEAEVPTA